MRPFIIYRNYDIIKKLHRYSEGLFNNSYHIGFMSFSNVKLNRLLIDKRRWWERK